MSFPRLLESLLRNSTAQSASHRCCSTSACMHRLVAPRRLHKALSPKNTLVQHPTALLAGERAGQGRYLPKKRRSSSSSSAPFPARAGHEEAEPDGHESLNLIDLNIDDIVLHGHATTAFESHHHLGFSSTHSQQHHATSTLQFPLLEQQGSFRDSVFSGYQAYPSSAHLMPVFSPHTLHHPSFSAANSSSAVHFSNTHRDSYQTVAPNLNSVPHSATWRDDFSIVSQASQVVPISSSDEEMLAAFLAEHSKCDVPITSAT